MSAGNSDYRNQEARKLLDQFFGGGFPFNDANNKMGAWLKESNWVNKLVQDALESAMPVVASGEKKAGTRTEQIVETDKYVSVKYDLPKVNPYSLRLYLTPGSMRIEGLPGGEKRTIKLPREVSLVGVRANYKDNVLHVRMPKRVYTGKERQINIDVE